MKGSGPRCFVLVSLFLSTPVPFARAREHPWRIEGTAGAARFTESEWHLTTGFGATRALTSRFRLGGEISYLFASEGDQDVALLSRILFDLRPPGKAYIPYLTGAVGVLWHRELVGFGPGGPPRLRPYWSSDPWVGGGVGLRARLTERWEVAPELQAAWPLVVHLAVRLGFRR